jgi:hypothetical protein
MSLTTIGSLPGGKDINDQFLPGTKIHKTLAILKRLTGHGGGGYHFGELTADFYNLTGQERQNWLNEAGTYPANVKDGIKNAIIAALSHLDTNGDPAPIPVVLTWTQNGGRPDINIIFEPLMPKYTIAIFNCLPPVASALADRRKKKNK